MAERVGPARPPQTAPEPLPEASDRDAGSRSLRSTFPALAERDFALFFTGNLAFFVATQMQFLTRGFLVFQLTDSAAALGYITAAGALPMLLGAPLGGVVADRVNKKRLLLITQIVAAGSASSAGVLVLTDVIQFWHLLIIGVVSGLVFAFNMPARQAIVPQLVPRHKLMNAISLQMGGQNLTRVVAPALAGVLIAPIGVGWVYILIAALFLLPVLSEFRIPDYGMTTARKKSARVHEDIAEAFRYIRGDRMISQLLILGLVFPLFAIPLFQLLPVFAEDVFDAGPSGLGLLAASTGVGGVIGALITAGLGRYPRKGQLMLLSGVWLGLLYVGFSLVDTIAPAVVFLALGSIGGVVLQTTNNVAVQSQVPEEIRGRVMSVVMMSFGLMPLGLIPLSQAADAFGPRAAVAGSSIIMIVLLLLAFGLSPALRNLRIVSRGRGAALTGAGGQAGRRRQNLRGPGAGTHHGRPARVAPPHRTHAHRHHTPRPRSDRRRIHRDCVHRHGTAAGRA